VNLRIGGFVVDAAWPACSLIVELDGYETHRGRAAFESDRARDLKLKLLGYETVPIHLATAHRRPCRGGRRPA